VEELSVSWTSSHVLFLIFQLLSCPEDTIFNQESTWLDDGLWLQEGILFNLFLFMCNDGAWVGLHLGQLEVNDEI
jgi:hypothetical protein